MACVYVLVDLETGHFKIGKANLVAARLDLVCYREKIDFDRSYEAVVPTESHAKRLEGMLHLIAHEFRLKKNISKLPPASRDDGATEWFDANGYELIMEAIKVQKNFFSIVIKEIVPNAAPVPRNAIKYERYLDYESAVSKAAQAGLEPGLIDAAAGAYNDKISSSLGVLAKIQGDFFRSADISRTHRERLVATGYVVEIINGWLMKKSASDVWPQTFDEFLCKYLQERFGVKYHLSPESSLRYQVGLSVPRQITVQVGTAINQVVELPFETSILVVARKRLAKRQEDVHGVQVMPIEDALCEVPESFFAANPLDAEIALKMIRDPSGLLRCLLEDGKSVVAGRLAGAYRFLGKPEFADSILSTMRSLGYVVREINPFRLAAPMLTTSRITSPYAERIRGLWAAWRETVVSSMPAPSALAATREEVLQRIDDIYTHDAYNSLSIEGYQVTPELIEKVRNGEWDPKGSPSDAQQRDAMAARGYWMTFNQVRDAVRDILDGQDQAQVVASRRHSWFMSLFAPSVQAGIIAPQHLAGFRSHPVLIRGSLHAPPHRDYIADCVEALNDCMRDEPEPAVRAILGHFFFVYIHPYMDGNGRTARFMMNAVLTSSGYPWTVIQEDRREEYFAALERASVGGQIDDFAAFVADEMNISVKLKRKVAP